MNIVLLLGNLGGNPELKYTPSGSPVATFSIATKVEIEIDGKRYTVAGEDMKVAIDNCMNTKRF